MVYLKWLRKNPKINSCTSWGIPWEKGKFQKNDAILLKDANGVDIQADTWPMAFWPDGSIKWSGHAAEFNLESKSYIADIINKVKMSKNKVSVKKINVVENEDSISIDTGKIICKINRSGKNIIEKIIMDNKVVAHSGSLEIINEIRNKNAQEEDFLELRSYTSEIESVEIEHNSNLRCVIKVTGIHKRNYSLSTSLIPFKIRLEFYYNDSNIKLIHTFFYDGDKDIDFIKGIGIKLKTDLIGDEINRKVGFSLETGMYLEASKLLLSRFFRYNNEPYQKQINGENIDVDSIDAKLLDVARKNTIWNNFKLSQDSSEHYKISKQSQEKLTSIDVLHGNRSNGMLYVACEEFGISASIKDFWQKAPAALEVKKLSENSSDILIWLWDPSSEAMDLRHYSDTYHMSAYEGFEEVRSTPYGIANTSEVYLNFYSQLPTKEDLYTLSNEYQEDNIIVCKPETYYNSKATGIWSLVKEENKMNPLEKKLEEELIKNFYFYKEEIEQRKWYGYWNYGDIMHTYDETRNQWMYDMGGYAWQNTELMPNVWLWYQFFRTNSAHTFKMARAMTRHNSEVDCYHLGEYKGLGSRHNVVHWGCSCKEARINMTLLYKYYYYLTCDERTGELLEESAEIDQSVNSLEPLRGFFPDESEDIHIRVGPDWSAYCSNWQTQWERTQDVKYRDKILKGIEFLKKQPQRLLTGPSVRYNPETSEMEGMGEKSKGEFHMAISFGAPQIWMEIADLLDDDVWKDMIAEFGYFYGISPEERKLKAEGLMKKKTFDWPEFAASMIAYSAKLYNNEELAAKAWKLLFNEINKGNGSIINYKEINSWRNINEDPLVTTNCVAQWCLNTMVCLELIGEKLKIN